MTRPARDPLGSRLCLLTVSGVTDMDSVLRARYPDTPVHIEEYFLPNLDGSAFVYRLATAPQQRLEPLPMSSHHTPRAHDPRDSTETQSDPNVETERGPQPGAREVGDTNDNEPPAPDGAPVVDIHEDANPGEDPVFRPPSRPHIEKNQQWLIYLLTVTYAAVLLIAALMWAFGPPRDLTSYGAIIISPVSTAVGAMLAYFFRSNDR